MTRRVHSSLPILILLIAAVAIFSAGCKKKPAPVAATPTPPPVARVEPTPVPVKEEPMTPVVEEPAATPSRMGAAEYNRQGLLKTVYFDTNRHEIRPDQRPALEANALKLKDAPFSSFNLLIEGHCDERNTSEYNMALGDRRANSVRQYLIGLGIPASRLRTISYGEERPVDPGHGEEAWAKNRRSEFVLEER